MLHSKLVHLLLSITIGGGLVTAGGALGTYCLSLLHLMLV